MSVVELDKLVLEEVRKRIASVAAVTIMEALDVDEETLKNPLTREEKVATLIEEFNWANEAYEIVCEACSASKSD